MDDDSLPFRKIFSALLASIIVSWLICAMFGDLGEKIVIGFIGIVMAILIPIVLFLLVVAPWLPKGVRDRWGL